MCEEHQFVGAGLDWDAYDVIVVKQGYIFPELKEKAAFSVMSLTQGATPAGYPDHSLQADHAPHVPH